ncbi:hypothetical protein IMW75_07930 [Pseudomonas gregormendelii]|uniref:Uncharacterized protein n=1 Tax=Pseudomonas gregormendelii TaxID=1628277 RepID=A0ABS3AE80_9PSED|nr:hypothetical protein [Pseudomonas gregormendelii]
MVIGQLEDGFEKGFGLKPASDRGPRVEPEDPSITILAKAKAALKRTSTSNGTAQVDTGWSRNSADTSLDFGHGNSSASSSLSALTTTPEFSTSNLIEPSPDQGDGYTPLDLTNLPVDKLANKDYWNSRRKEASASAATPASHALPADAETGQITTVQHSSDEVTAGRSASPVIRDVEDISQHEDASVVTTLEQRLSWQVWNKLPTVGVTESEKTDSNIDEDPPEAPPAITPTTWLNSPSRKIKQFEEQAGGGRRVLAVNTPLAQQLNNLGDRGTTSRLVLPGGQTDSSSAATNYDVLTDILKAQDKLKPSNTGYSRAREALVQSIASADTASNVGRDNMAALADRSSSATTAAIGTGADVVDKDQAQNRVHSSPVFKLPSMRKSKIVPAKVYPKVNTDNTFAGSVSSGSATRGRAFLV